jgi:hypothetical protein
MTTQQANTSSNKHTPIQKPSLLMTTMARSAASATVVCLLTGIFANTIINSELFRHLCFDCRDPLPLRTISFICSGFYGTYALLYYAVYRSFAYKD